MGVSPIGVPQGLAHVLNSAGDKSNVDFDYLLQLVPAGRVLFYRRS